MRKKELYSAPRVLKSVKVEHGTSILIGSRVEQRMDLETAGHEVEDHDYDETGFNHEWK